MFDFWYAAIVDSPDNLFFKDEESEDWKLIKSVVEQVDLEDRESYFEQFQESVTQMDMTLAIAS